MIFIFNTFTIKKIDKPKIVFAEQENINSSVMYTTNGRKEIITCRVSAYPEPRVTLMYNDQQIQADKFTLEENKNVPRQVCLFFFYYDFRR